MKGEVSRSYVTGVERVIAVVLAACGGGETRREVAHDENCYCGGYGGAVMLRLC